MSAFMRCDGCGAEICQLPVDHSKGQKERLIHGERVNGSQGLSPIPNGEFDWCEDCARVAFSAVRDRPASIPHADLRGDVLIAHLRDEHETRFMPSDVRENPDRPVQVHRDKHSHVASPHRSDRQGAQR
jgi:hypothetical protein